MTDYSRTLLTRRRALAGVAGIGLASAGAGAGTLAYFSDSEQSTGNAIEAGTMELSVSNGYTYEYSFRDVAPGDERALLQVADGEWADRDLEFDGDAVNTGSVDADCLAVYIEHETTPGEGRDGSSMEDELEIETLNWEGSEYVADYDVLSEEDANPPSDFDFTVDGEDFFEVFDEGDSMTAGDLAGQELRFHPAPRPNGNSNNDGRTFGYTFRVSEEMGNEYQGAELTTDIHFALLQDESQSFDGTIS